MIDPVWTKYTFQLNLTDYADILGVFTAGEVIDGDSGLLFAEALNEKDKKEGKGHWNSEPGLLWSLHGATVFYNGANNTDYPTKGTMQRVLILDFPEGAQKPSGRVFFTYNAGA